MPAFSRPPFRARLFAPAFSRPPFRARLFAPAFSCLSLSFALLLAVASFCAADPLVWNADAQGQFIASLCRDTRGNVWIGTEDQGVYRLDPTAPAGTQYTHFTTKDGLGDDDVYALACDKAGRVWAGTLNHGVSVYNGKQWKTYGVLDGPLGSRVFALAVSPKDGGVWGAAEAGLFRYGGGRWQQYSRLDGLPSDAVQCLAFAPDGTLYVGTQCDGIAVGSPANDYKTWRTAAGSRQAPDLPEGDGLPTGLINCLLVTHSGTVYAGTTSGLALSRDSGRTWRYTGGADWLDKANGRARPPGLTFQDNPKISGLEVIPVTPRPGEQPVAIAAGSAVAVGAFAADHDFTGGNAYTLPGTVDTLGAPAPAPPAVYRSERWGRFAYLIPGLTPHGSYHVRLHFAEIGLSAPGKRVFGMRINGEPVLTNFDVFASAGGANRAVVEGFPAQADFRGQILIQSDAGVLASPTDAHLLSEDYVTALAEDGAGHLLVGHRQTGLELRDGLREVRVYPGAGDAASTDYVNAFLPLRDGGTLVGRYGGGLARVYVPGFAAPALAALPVAAAPASIAVAALPLPAQPPTLAELNGMLRVVSAVAPDKDELQPKVVALADDWVTEGDWLGRYGRYWACLCATSTPTDYVWGSGWESVRYALQNGPNRAGDDKLRYWIQWLYTQNPRVLELPAVYLDTRVLRKLTTWDNNRRESEVDDHGEDYPMTKEGPNVYCTLTVPNGLYYLSLYDFNKDGHDQTGNYYRDYRISIRPHPAGKGIGDISDFAQQPEWASGRIHDFWGGVYKRFLVRGPQELTIEVNRNHSFNTILPAVMLDLVDENPPPYSGTPEQRLAWRNTQRQRLLTQWQAKGPAPRFLPAPTEAQAAAELFDALQGLQFTNGTWRAINGRRFYGSLLRWYAAQVKRPSAPDKSLLSHLGTCDYQMGLYAPWEQVQRQAGLTPARDVEKALRWDGTNGMGHGFEAVSDYVSGRSTVAQKGWESRPALSFPPGTVEAGGH